MAQDHGLCRKKVSQKGTGARAASAGPCCSCQQDSLAACKHVGSTFRRSWRTWTEQGKSKMNGGKMLRRAVGMAWQRRAGTQPAEQATAGGHSQRILRPAQASRNNGQQLAGLAAKQWPQMMLAGLSPCSAGKWRECNGIGTQEGGLRPT